MLYGKLPQEAQLFRLVFGSFATSRPLPLPSHLWLPRQREKTNTRDAVALNRACGAGFAVPISPGWRLLGKVTVVNLAAGEQICRRKFGAGVAARGLQGAF